MTSWSIPSLLLGFHVLHGLLAGIHTSPHNRNAWVSQPKPITRARSRYEPNAFTNLPQVLERRVDIRKLVPRKKNLKLQRLMRKLGKDFDTFWMSQRLPNDFSHILTKKNVDASLRSKTASLDLSTFAKEVYAGLQSFANRTGNNDSNSVQTSNTTTPNIDDLLDSERAMSNIVYSLESWLVHVGSCPVYYRWEDLGPLYWPRWVRRGSCSRRDTGNYGPLRQSFRKRKKKQLTESSTPHPTSYCSWPPGMHCIPANEKKIKVLRWTCTHSKFYEAFAKFRRTGRKKYKANSQTSNSSTSHIFTHGSPLIDQQHNLEDDNHVDFDHHDVDNDDAFHTDESHIETDDKPVESEQFRKLLSKTYKHKKENNRVNQRLDKKSRHSQGKIDAREVPENKNYKHSKMVSTIQSKLAKQLHLTTWSPDTRTQKNRIRRDSRKSHKTDGHGKSHRRGRKRKPGFRCKWVKIEYPVTDDCYCSC